MIEWTSVTKATLFAGECMAIQVEQSCCVKKPRLLNLIADLSWLEMAVWSDSLTEDNRVKNMERSGEVWNEEGPSDWIWFLIWTTVCL